MRIKLFRRQAVVVITLLFAILVFTDDDYLGMKSLFIWEETSEKEDTGDVDYDFSNFKKTEGTLPSVKAFIAATPREILISNKMTETWPPFVIHINSDNGYKFDCEDYIKGGHDIIIPLRKFKMGQKELIPKDIVVTRVILDIPGFSRLNKALR